ncbi:FUSC family protein [Clostridium amazonitimonense]|uniref:FUSC family protein n=1 Tax=Clostridium amazonitimonense TaxID=1499689 RepID=UPI0005096DA6|nr:aromatic acid exporter family protein [Clostridium amazonitimonense]
MKIGMRTIKTALAVSICILLSRIFTINNALYACIAAIITMGNTVTNSYKSGINRIKGTLVGAIVGLIMSLVAPENIILVGIGIVIIISICNYFRLDKSVAISCTVFCVITISLNGRSPLQYSIYRTLDTILGIVVSLIINYTIAPPKIHENVVKAYKDLKNDLFDLCKKGILNPKDFKLDEFKHYIDNLESCIKLHDEEFLTVKDSLELIDDYKEFMKDAKKLYIYFEMMNTMQEELLILNDENRGFYEEIFESIYEIEVKDIKFPQRSYVIEDENIVYNYNVSKICGILKNIKNNPIMV